MICIDAYHFFGCDPEYLDAHIAPLVKPGGFIAAAIPGLRQEFTGDIPDELRPYWKEDINFHSAGWWAELWKQSTRAAVRDAFSLRSHKAAWEDWLQCDNLCTARCRHDGKGRLALLRFHRHHRYRVPGSLFGTVPPIIR